jgi:hypothetical protein
MHPKIKCVNAENVNPVVIETQQVVLVWKIVTNARQVDSNRVMDRLLVRFAHQQNFPALVKVNAILVQLEQTLMDNQDNHIVCTPQTMNV